MDAWRLALVVWPASGTRLHNSKIAESTYKCPMESERISPVNTVQHFLLLSGSIKNFKFWSVNLSMSGPHQHALRCMRTDNGWWMDPEALDRLVASTPDTS